MQNNSPSIVRYTYDEMKLDLIGLTTQMEKDNYKPDLILGLTRGGLVPAVMLSHFYNIKMIPVNLSLRDFKSDLSLVNGELDQADIDISCKNILVVDDILDSGESLRELSELFIVIPKFNQFDIRYAVLYNNVSNICAFEPNYYSRKIDKNTSDDWIQFSFEKWWE